MNTTTQKMFERAQREHDEQVARGEHDEHCEHGLRVRDGSKVMSYLCNCSKRRREREGYITPPGPLEWRAPLCPRCHAAVDHDGDVWVCPPCSAAWFGGANARAEFTDEYGDL